MPYGPWGPVSGWVGPRTFNPWEQFSQRMMGGLADFVHRGAVGQSPPFEGLGIAATTLARHLGPLSPIATKAMTGGLQQPDDEAYLDEPALEPEESPQMQHLAEAAHTGVVDAQALGLPPGLLKNTFDEVNRLLGEQTAYAEGQYKQHQGMADQLYGQLQTQAAASDPTNDPKAEFYTRLAGNISQALAPEMGGQAQSEKVLGQNLTDIRSQRNRQMQLLAQRYQQEADRAEKFGDMTAGLKFREKANLMLKQAELQIEEGKVRATLATRGDNTMEKRAQDVFKGLDSLGETLGKRAGEIATQLRDYRRKNKNKSFKRDKFTDAMEDSARDWQFAKTMIQANLAKQRGSGQMPDPFSAQLATVKQLVVRDVAHAAASGTPVDLQTLMKDLTDTWSELPYSELGIPEEVVQALYQQEYSRRKLPMAPPAKGPGLFDVLMQYMNK